MFSADKSLRFRVDSCFFRICFYDFHQIYTDRKIWILTNTKSLGLWFKVFSTANEQCVSFLNEIIRNPIISVLKSQEYTLWFLTVFGRQVKENRFNVKYSIFWQIQCHKYIVIRCCCYFIEWNQPNTSCYSARFRLSNCLCPDAKAFCAIMSPAF